MTQPGTPFLVPVVGGAQVLRRLGFERDGDHLDAFATCFRTLAQDVPLGAS